jgi:hypothetical protein
MDTQNPVGPKIRVGQLVEFLRRNLFRVKLSNGVDIVAVMPDELLPSFDPNVQLTRYNYPYVDVEIGELPQSPKIVAIRRSSGWCGAIHTKFWEYEE